MAINKKNKMFSEINQIISNGKRLLTNGMGNMKTHSWKLLFVFFTLIGLVVLHVIASSIKNYTQNFLQLLSNDQKTNDTIAQDPESNIAFTIIARVVYFTIMMAGIGVMLMIYGIRVVSFTVVASSLVIFLGLALQGTSGDFISGILLIFENRYDTGDTIELNEMVGKVVDFTILYTKILENDGKHIVTIPNRLVYNTVVQNHTRLKYRHIKLTVLVANNNKNIEPFLRDVEETLSKADNVVRDVPVVASVTSIKQQGMEINVRLKIIAQEWPVVNNVSYQDSIMGIIYDLLKKHGIILQCGNFPCNSV